MTQRQRYKVSEVARATGVSIRTLHHYDDIGLLIPSARTDTGYRLYSDEDLLRLQQILINRELGLPLEDIRRMLDDPAFDRRGALLRQRAELEKRAERATKMIGAIDAALADISQTEQSMDVKQFFDGFDPSAYEVEVKQRWGDSDAYRESARRTKGYSAQDWERYGEENDAIMRDAAAALQSGKPPDDQRSIEIAERHRLCIDRWFYPCSNEMHVMLADMYEADERFAANIDAYAPGLTAFLSAAIRANAKPSSGD